MSGTREPDAEQEHDAGSSPAGPRPGTPARPSAGVPGPVGNTAVSRFVGPPQPTMHPRKVRGGQKLSTKEGPVSTAWSAQRWMRLVEDCAPGDALTEGMQYARLGQTRWLNIGAGHISARVQGRLPTPYNVDIRLPVFTFEQWEQVIEVMSNEARPVASLLAGEVPSNIEDLFSPLRLHLFPAEASHLSLSCTCSRNPPMVRGPGGVMMPAPMSTIVAATPASPWCKHVCCVMALVAERLASDTFLIIQLRGLAKEDLLERLRQRRSMSAARGSAGGSGNPAVNRPVPAYLPRLPGVSDQAALPLEQCAESFWRFGHEIDDLDLALTPPAVSHPLLRRLGSSPFAGAKFPLVGLLATCYEVIGQKALPEQTPGRLGQ